jgi:hypothetical protein
MKLTLKAILARFNGKHSAAIQYCEDVAHVYPHLRSEYRQHREALLDQMQSEVGIKFTTAAHA